MKYSDLYKYRGVWMGFAIAWIFFYHMGFNIDVSVIKAFKDIGYAGCDIFLFASGLGIYYSLEKNDNVYQYITKRISRLMPMFWIVLLFWLPFKFYIGEMNWQGAIGNILGIQFLIDYNYDFNWYISVTILCYFLAPFLKKQMDSFKWQGWKIIVLIIIIAATYAFSTEGYRMLGMCRIGGFYLGMIFGQLGCRGKKISVVSRIIWICLIPIGVGGIYYSLTHLGFVGWVRGTTWLPFVIAIPGVCIALSLICMLLDKSKVGTGIIKCIDFMGRHSLEIYLVHATAVMVFRDWMIKNDSSLDTATNWWIVVGVSIVGAILLYWVDRLIRLPFCKNVKKETQ